LLRLLLLVAAVFYDVQLMFFKHFVVEQDFFVLLAYFLKLGFSNNLRFFLFIDISHCAQQSHFAFFFDLFHFFELSNCVRQCEFQIFYVLTGVLFLHLLVVFPTLNLLATLLEILLRKLGHLTNQVVSRIQLHP